MLKKSTADGEPQDGPVPSQLGAQGRRKIVCVIGRRVIVALIERCVVVGAGVDVLADLGVEERQIVAISLFSSSKKIFAASRRARR